MRAYKQSLKFSRIFENYIVKTLEQFFRVYVASSKRSGGSGFSKTHERCTWFSLFIAVDKSRKAKYLKRNGRGTILFYLNRNLR